MKFNSLLWLEDSQEITIDQSVIKDLGLTEVYEQLLEISEENEALIYKLCTDGKTIDYRLSIFEELMKNEELLNELKENLDVFLDLETHMRKDKYDVSSFYFLLDLVLIVEISMEAMEKLHSTLQYYEIESKGLILLREMVSDEINSEKFKAMIGKMEAGGLDPADIERLKSLGYL